MFFNNNKKEPPPKEPSSFRSYETIISSTVICTTFIGGFYIYRAYFRRIPSANRIPDYFLRKRSMLGKVTSVGDADNFHFYHTPGGVFGGWGWLRHAPDINSRGLKDQTIHVRLCGVDAPEGAHFGKPAQMYSEESLEWLRSYILGRKVRIIPLARDQYQRVVSQATVWKLTGRKNISKEMLRNGWAVVYESRSGAEFNGYEEEFRYLELQSRRKKIGIFQKGIKHFVSPGEYKKASKTEIGSSR
jgi:endonuclease YncB( thermonuclease family)